MQDNYLGLLNKLTAQPPLLAMIAQLSPLPALSSLACCRFSQSSDPPFLLPWHIRYSFFRRFFT
jgi:hypothetical protein